MDIQRMLFEHQDLKYKDFHAKLIPTVPQELIIGVRIPDLRKLAKEVYKSNAYKDFLSALPHKYYEEDNLHAFLIENIKDFETAIAETEKFLPYIDNWATCDSFLPPVFKKSTDRLLPYVLKWIKSDSTYTVRYGIVILMKLFSDDKFKEEFLHTIVSVKSDEYYIKMAVAWYFAELLAKQYKKTIPFIENRVLDEWTHNKAIQKATESFRISVEIKEHLKTLKKGM